MTAAHLFFAIMTTAYILIAIQFEERDLVAVYGSKYEQYREHVPMIIPSMTSAEYDPLEDNKRVPGLSGASR